MTKTWAAVVMAYHAQAAPGRSLPAVVASLRGAPSQGRRRVLDMVSVLAITDTSGGLSRWLG